MSFSMDGITSPSGGSAKHTVTFPLPCFYKMVVFMSVLVSNHNLKGF